MYKNYLKTVWRNLLKNKSLSLINIGGLAVGIASSLLLLNYATYQFGYDSFNVKGKDIYRVNLSLYESNKLVFQSAENYPALAPSALIALLIAIVTISFQAIKAAIANPVKSLRTE